MSNENDAESTFALLHEAVSRADTDLAHLRAYLHRVIEALPDAAVRTLARMMALTTRPPVQGDG
jgi:hypothetical protein